MTPARAWVGTIVIAVVVGLGLSYAADTPAPTVQPTEQECSRGHID